MNFNDFVEVLLLPPGITFLLEFLLHTQPVCLDFSSSLIVSLLPGSLLIGLELGDMFLLGLQSIWH